MSKPLATFQIRLAVCLLAILCASTFGQEKNPPAVCEQDGALAILDQQIAATKTFDDEAQRVVVLIRAGELLWPYQQERARAVFGEAFELANRYYQENGNEPRSEGVGMAIIAPDPRYTVIGAIAKRDTAWARRLTARFYARNKAASCRRRIPKGSIRKRERPTNS